jgi:hypothetical protein
VQIITIVSLFSLFTHKINDRYHGDSIDRFLEKPFTTQGFMHILKVVLNYRSNANLTKSSLINIR